MYTTNNIGPISGCYPNQTDNSQLIHDTGAMTRYSMIIQSVTGLIKNRVRIGLYFSKIQDDSYGIIAQISCIMPSFHKPNLTDIIGCVWYMHQVAIQNFGPHA